MTKYMITTDGVYFYVRRYQRWFIFWDWEYARDSGDAFRASQIIRFANEEAAVRYAEEHYGKDARRIRKERIV